MASCKKCLGVTLTPHLAFGKHFTDRVLTFKFAMNSVYSKLFENKKVPITAEWEVFKRACAD